MDSEQFSALVKKKFGTKRGMQWSAAKALGIQQGNLSSMMNGRISIAQKHVDALLDMPDYHPPIGVSTEFHSEVNQLSHHFTTELTPDAFRHLDFVSRYYSKGYTPPDLGADPALTAIFFEKVLHITEGAMRMAQPDIAAKVDAAIEADRTAERAEFNADLKAHRHLVADELDGDDPLS